MKEKCAMRPPPPSHCAPSSFVALDIDRCCRLRNTTTLSRFGYKWFSSFFFQVSRRRGEVSAFQHKAIISVNSSIRSINFRQRIKKDSYQSKGSLSLIAIALSLLLSVSYFFFFLHRRSFFLHYKC